MDAQIPNDPQTTTAVDIQQQAQQDLLITPQDLLKALISSPALVSLLTIFGWLIRYIFVAGLAFPLNSGGTLYQMTTALIDNNFRLPAFFVYNRWDVPFAHPPIGLYMVGGWSVWRGVPLFEAFVWVPFYLSVLVIPLFFLLARDMLRHRLLAFSATLVFMFTPGMVVRLITGGSVVYGVGLVFAILTLITGFRMITRRQDMMVVPTGVLLTLTLLSHAETGYFTIMTLILLLIVFARKPVSLLHMLFVTLLTLIGVLVWATPVLLIHGVEPFLNVLPATSLFQNVTAAPNPNTLFTDEQYLPLFTVLGILGAFVATAKRNFFLPLWLVFTMLVLSNEMLILAVLPLSMLTAVAINQLILPVLRSTSYDRYENGIPYIEYYGEQAWLRWVNRRLYLLPVIAFFIVFALISAVGAYYSVENLVTSDAFVLSVEDRNAIEWSAKYPTAQYIKRNKMEPPPPIYLVISDAQGWRTDPANIWFPILTSNATQTSVAGSGWAGRFQRAKDNYNAFRGCINRSVTCLYEREAAVLGITVEGVEAGTVAPLYTYILFTSGAEGALIESVTQSDQFERIYSRDGVRIFERQFDPAVFNNPPQATP